ncbi:MAG: MmcQ/YjbR family DNA-binding protein [Thermoplasmata archaeon]|nr:MmcQ/YjbR family DNA-binding protein [Thermoplasmata archaeon]
MPAAQAPDNARERIARLAEEMAAGDGEISAHRKGFGTRSMFVGRKMFAVLDRTGEIVLKLPPERVKELIDSNTGRGWSPGSGSPLKEYLAIPFARQKEWPKFAREARAYMGGKS